MAYFSSLKSSLPKKTRQHAKSFKEKCKLLTVYKGQHYLTSSKEINYVYEHGNFVLYTKNNSL